MNINTSFQSTELPVTEILDSDEVQVDPAFDRIGGNRLQNLLEMDLPRPKALMSHHGYGVQGAVAGKYQCVCKNHLLIKQAKDKVFNEICYSSTYLRLGSPKLPENGTNLSY